MGKSLGFDRLHEGVQRWIWQQNWTELRDIQEQAIEPILRADSDVIISATTAAGKTEAAFLPACSNVVKTNPSGIGILYISPLKALINDQYRRLQSLCELLGLKITPWHGDVSRTLKEKQKKKPNGIVLITPESLESLLLNQSGWCKSAFDGLGHIIIDEFHAFLGTERGRQLQSLMHRLEFLLGRTIPRIALSATLGDMQQVAASLRLSRKHTPCVLIESAASKADLKVQLRGYLNSASSENENADALELITEDLFQILRGKSHLIFANSRGRTESIAAGLADLCRQEGLPNEFFPHHGSLSKEIRESLEQRLQEGLIPTSAVCTMTLELGIDIGSVDSIAQVTAPHSVASLRQRLGRSGRRGEAAVLRLFIPEEELSDSSNLIDQLRLQTVQCIAMINLLLKKWCEPVPNNNYHLSTLAQQTLSVIGQYGGVRADQLWSLLCKTGPFVLVDQNLYVRLLRALGEHDLITQAHDGLLTLGFKGEKLIENFTFYTAFNTPEEYRLECDGRILGTVPIDMPLMLGQLIVFAGRRWKVINVEPEKKVIMLKKASAGKPPQFGGGGLGVHDRIREEMQRVYEQKSLPIYLDSAAKEIVTEGVEHFHSLSLDKVNTLQIGSTVHILPWLGDQITSTIVVLLKKAGLSADCYGGVIEVRNCSMSSFYHAVETIVESEKPLSHDLANLIPDTVVDKYDPLMPKDMRELSYGTRFFDVDGAFEWLRTLLRKQL